MKTITNISDTEVSQLNCENPEAIRPVEASQVAILLSSYDAIKGFNAIISSKLLIGYIRPQRAAYIVDQLCH